MELPIIVAADRATTTMHLQDLPGKTVHVAHGEKAQVEAPILHREVQAVLIRAEAVGVAVATVVVDLHQALDQAAEDINQHRF
jgi:hypothetical protein